MKIILSQCAQVLQQTLRTPRRDFSGSEDSLLISLNSTLAGTAPSMNRCCCQLLCNKDLFPKTHRGQQTIIWQPPSSLAEEQSQFKSRVILGVWSPPLRHGDHLLFAFCFGRAAACSAQMHFVCFRSPCTHRKQKAGLG